MMAILFFLGITAISYEHVGFSLLILAGFAIWLVANKEKRFVTSLLLSFLVCFALFMVFNNFVGTMGIPKETKVILNRLSLGFMILGMVLVHLFFHKKVCWYNQKPDWKNPIVLPFHKIHTFPFWLIGIVINLVIYGYFILQKDWEYLKSLLWFCLLFSFINAVFEEVIWRGIMLSALKDVTSTGYAVLVTSIGFGLLHLAIGFSIALSLLISVAGVIYAILTLKTNSLYPSIVFHIVISIGMVYSGFII
ncbi:type II CAAX endopeptidase family protein [Bacillus sp. FJAT-27251]|uniref:CPBP family intramembrane glutamic endopeptidase n=1 Tax=Bacillus sp. FJAT-27251 TaxID=1684142 RepID=UPI0006A7BDBC|nr:type II CAAX endopeptidase family protein [Bacillus sp. FJAT-27251]